MSDCCSSQTCATQSKRTKAVCPQNGREYSQVPYKTVLYQISLLWLYRLAEQNYYFCSDPACDVVYFGDDGTLVKKYSLRQKVTCKEESDEVDLCYCFGISRKAARADAGLKQFVVEMTKNKHCACETMNPSGRCCLKDFPN